MRARSEERDTHQGSDTFWDLWQDELGRRVLETLSLEGFEELFVNGSRSFEYLTEDGTLWRKDPLECSQRQMGLWLMALAHASGTRVDANHPASGGVFEIPQGLFRWHGVLPILSPEGPLLSVRKVLQSVADVPLGTKDGDVVPMRTWLLNRFSLLIAGPTGAGKTTFLTGILNKYFPSARVVLLETLPEIPLCSERWIRLVGSSGKGSSRNGTSLSHLLTESLRLRPEVFAIGEIRDQEASTFFEAIETGHGGALATIHGDSVDDVARRLHTLAPHVKLTKCSSFTEEPEDMKETKKERDQKKVGVVVVTHAGSKRSVKEWGVLTF